jgi:AAA domain, putative AbiEii toxin, Type IV TA system
MKIKSLLYGDTRGEGWSLDTLPLKDRLNLFVGASGSGKTRVLNMLFNIGRFAAQDGDAFANGQWTLHFEHVGIDYTWKYDGDRVGDEREPQVLSEDLWRGTPTHVEESLFVRNEQVFQAGEMRVPKLDKGRTAIHLLREEGPIKPVHEAFSAILRRSFWGDSLQRSVVLQPVSSRLVKKLEKPAAQVTDISRGGLNLHLTLYFLQEYFPQAYGLVLEQFTRVFPFVSDIRIRPVTEAFVGADVDVTGDILVATIKERGIAAPVPLNEISSGMLKVLLIITDVVTGPPYLLYMIDEYENSLGVNAINFLPSFLADCGGDRQFIVTTHHPLLINAIPVSDWFIFHRKGLHIRVMHGSEIVERYGRSKQQRFIQLINDPLYAEGVE